MLTLRRMLSVPAGRRIWSATAITDVAISLLTLLLIAGAVLYAAVPTDLPRPVPASTPPTVFSSERALNHIRVIAREPHPLGSPANAAVRDYLLQELTALGLQPEVQKVTAAHESIVKLVAGTPENVIARVNGTETGKAFMLVAHYDSVASSPGASDDGAGVAALLETARALTATPSLRNDVIFLFTDGEEAGLLGARAFVDHHAWAKDVGVVLNVEARGHRGAVRLFETSKNNDWLIREFAQAVPYPVTTSADTAGYKLSGSDTDLSVFMDAGLPGLNVAYLDGLVHYHSPLDTVKELDERSLQHLGSSVLVLALQLGNAELDQPKLGDAVFFSVLRFVVHYPVEWAIPWMACVLLLFAAVVAFGWRRHELTIGGIVFGFVALLLSMTAVVLVVFPLWLLIRALNPGDNLWALQYHAYLFWVGFACLSSSITAALYNLFRRKFGVASLHVGALLWPLVFMVLTSLLDPAASFAPTWSLLFSLLGLAALFILGDAPAHPWHRWAALMLSGIPTMLVMAPALAGVTRPVGLMLTPIVPIFALVVVLLLGFLMPQLDLVARPNQWVVPVGAALIGLGLVLVGSFTAGFDARHPKPNDIFYALNANTGEAVWASSDEAPDAWTAQFLGLDATKGSIAAYLPGTSLPRLHRAAPTAALAAPNLVLLDDITRAGIRSLRLRITTPSQANQLIMAVETKASIVGAAVNGIRVPTTRDRSESTPLWTLNYWNPPAEGIELTLEVTGTEPLILTMTAQTPGLPTIAGATYRARPPHTMPQQWGDRTLVSKSWTFAVHP